MGQQETDAAKSYLLNWQGENPGGRLFRNNTGAALQGDVERTKSVVIIKKPRVVRFGVGLPMKNSRGQLQPKGGGDYIGWTKKYCCELFHYCPDGLLGGPLGGCCAAPDICEHFTAVFTSLEVKTGGQKQTPHQLCFSNTVKEAGGITLLAKDNVIK
jgi:hypothetical protein